MKRKISILFILGTLLFMFSFLQMKAQSVERVEPLCWWTDMKTDLQLMFYGKDLQNSTVKVLEQGMLVKAVHNADSPNYLFVDIDVQKAGIYTIEITKGKKKIKTKYEIHNRREGSAERIGFTQADVIYLLMPDRFANGDPSNDSIAGTKPKLDRSGLETRHGGDLQGIIDHMDYMADLGVTTIWPTPVLDDNQYYHQYICSDFYKIDPHMGNNKLYRDMVAIAHSKGLKVIKDVTPDHVNITHWWMKDLPFKDWVNDFEKYGTGNYMAHTIGDPNASVKDQDKTSKSWWIKELPDMNMTNPFVMKYLIQCHIFWIEYANLDGLRVDTYFYMGKEAGIWTKGIKDEYPNMGMVGEVWVVEPATIGYWMKNDRNRDGFNSHIPMLMDFPFELSILIGFKNTTDLWDGGMMKIYKTLTQDFVYDSPNTSLVIFADNHDLKRIYTEFGRSLPKVKMAMTLVSTMRGIPQIYYGTELLFENDPRGQGFLLYDQCRPDFPGGWPGDSVNLFLDKDRNPDQREMFNHVRTLLHFRKNNPVVYNGKFMHFIPRNNMYTYFRYDNKECVMVIINAAKETQPIDWNHFEERLSGKRQGTEILTGKVITTGNPTEIPAETSMVIHFL